MDESGSLSEEHSRTLQTIKEVSAGKNYQIDMKHMDMFSAAELRRLLRDLSDRITKSRHEFIRKATNK